MLKDLLLILEVLSAILIVQFLKRESIQDCLRHLSHLSHLNNSPTLLLCDRGHMPEWYTKSFGHLCAAEVVKIRDSFSNQNTETKDTKSR